MIDQTDRAHFEHAARDAIFPQVFFADKPSPAASAIYLNDPGAIRLLQFFRAKSLAAIKDEDQREQWYGDWIAYQAEHQLYARLLAPKQLSTLGSELNLLRLVKFIEVFGYCSPAHGYNLQVSFLGIFSIFMGSNLDLKREAVAKLERGGLFAFGISEKKHGSDLLANGFTIQQTAPGRYTANGSKYYIGNANCASIISILARKEDRPPDGRPRRPTLALFALRPGETNGFQNLRKIRTLGVRAAFVGEFDVKDHELPESDLVAEGRKAWDAVFGTVTLGKFFLGFGQIGICQRAFQEAVAHLSARILYGNPAIQLPHLRSTMAEAYARLTAMKLYAYRALDYVQAASATDRRYLLFTAVQKAKVSTEGVKVMALLSECIGAKGFESDTYFESALRDAQLIPGLEGSAHINLGLAAQFIPAYFDKFEPVASVPKSTFAGQTPASENSYLMEASWSHINAIRFPRFTDAFRPLVSDPNVRLFARQSMAFRLFIRRAKIKSALLADTEIALALGNCAASIAYGQLIAENCRLLDLPEPVVSVIFHLLVRDLSQIAMRVATLPRLDELERKRIRRLIVVPNVRGEDWEFVANRACNPAD